MKQSKLLIFLCSFLVLVSKAGFCAGLFNVKDYGAVGDGVTMNTIAVQKAIDVCSEVGGGKVWIPAGRLVIGMVQVKSHVTLSLDYGTELLGSQNKRDYPIENLRPAKIKGIKR